MNNVCYQQNIAKYNHEIHNWAKVAMQIFSGVQTKHTHTNIAFFIYN